MLKIAWVNYTQAPNETSSRFQSKQTISSEEMVNPTGHVKLAHGGVCRRNDRAYKRGVVLKLKSLICSPDGEMSFSELIKLDRAPDNDSSINMHA
jgi:hypothetical protein